MNGFANGFFGCFGGAAAVLVVIVALIAFGSPSTPRRYATSPSREDTVARLQSTENLPPLMTNPVQFCAAGFAQARRAAPRALQGYLGSLTPPQRPSPAAYPNRVACFSDGPGGVRAQFTFDVLCGDYSDPTCVRLVSVLTHAGPVFVDRAALEEAQN
jgi:hypothetical protein